MLSAFSLRDIQQESLVSGNVPGSVADRVRGFRHRANFRRPFAGYRIRSPRRTHDRRAIS